MTDLNTLLDFVKFTHEIRQIKRTIHFETNDRQENDAEHGYQLALIAWFLIENDKLTLDKDRCIAMALAHDTIEVHAGDVSAHLPQHNHPDRKKSEKLAVDRLKQDLPTFKSFHEAIDEYETQETPEANFVYALDKLMPPINIYLYGGRTWRLKNMGYEAEKKIQVDKVKVDKDINSYYEQLHKILKKHPELFGKGDQ